MKTKPCEKDGSRTRRASISTFRNAASSKAAQSGVQHSESKEIDMLKLLSRFIIISVTLPLAACSVFKLFPGQSVILEGYWANDAMAQCSRSAGYLIEATWMPTKDEIRLMESSFPKLLKLRSNLCCVSGARIDDINRFFRQYIGIVVNGRKLMYLNAYPTYQIINSEDGTIYKMKPVKICDGGTSYWGALYDPRTGEFFDLAFNGIS
jgi:hypothetical protein